MPFERVLLDESVLARLRRDRAVLSPSDMSRLPPDAVKLAESLHTEIQPGSRARRWSAMATYVGDVRVRVDPSMPLSWT